MKEPVAALLMETLDLIDEVIGDGYLWSSEALIEQCKNVETLRDRYAQPLVELIQSEYRNGTPDERLHQCGEFIADWLRDCRTLAALVAQNPETVQNPLTSRYLPRLRSDLRKDINRRLVRLMAAEEASEDSGTKGRKRPSGTSGAAQRTPKALSVESRALATLVSHGEARSTLAAIAKEVGCSRTHLYKCSHFMKAWKIRQESQTASARVRISRGSKGADGRIEAFGEMSHERSVDD